VLRGTSIALVVAAVAVAIAGCGAKKNDLAPAACLATDRAYLRALEQAPGEVRLAGTTAISDCLVPEQDGGQLANVGQPMVVAATKLNAQARSGSDTAALQLGYLIGAVSRGADPIHTDLVRRLNSAAQFSQTGGSLPASFQRVFARGYAAGRASG
jgi:hypothetical protein